MPGHVRYENTPGLGVSWTESVVNDIHTSARCVGDAGGLAQPRHSQHMADRSSAGWPLIRENNGAQTQLNPEGIGLLKSFMAQ